MAKNSIRDYSATAASNTDIGGIAIQGTNVVSNFDNAFRELMAQLADMNGGVDAIDDTMTWCDPTDATKKFRFDGVGITTATTRTITMPNASGTMALLNQAQSWTAAQTFTSSVGVTISSINPTINLTDTDTGGDCVITANNTTGSLTISADSGNEVAASVISFSVDGTQRGYFDSSSNFYSLGGMVISSATPMLTFTDTDTGADAVITSNSAAGSIIIHADINNEAASSAVGFAVDGAIKATIDSNGDFNVATWSASGATVGMTYDASEGISRSSQNASTAKYHFAFYNTNGLVGGITTSGSATSFSTSSDYRRKPVREELVGFWPRIKATIPRRFQWDNGAWDTGFIAHEFAVAYPSSVFGEKDAVDEQGNPIYQSMQASSSQVIADMMAALQDLEARISILEGKQ